MAGYIDKLGRDEAIAILKALAREDARMATRIETMARQSLARVSAESVAELVYLDLDALDVHDLWDQAGPSRYGYKDTGDVAWAMIEDAVEPYLEELRKLQACALWEAAKEQALGILQGIHQFETESASEFKGWAVDIPGQILAQVCLEFKKGQTDKGSLEEVTEFIAELPYAVPAARG